jgi:hypothetical protein
MSHKEVLARDSAPLDNIGYVAQIIFTFVSHSPRELREPGSGYRSFRKLVAQRQFRGRHGWIRSSET